MGWLDDLFGSSDSSSDYGSSDSSSWFDSSSSGFDDPSSWDSSYWGGNGEYDSGSNWDLGSSSDSSSGWDSWFGDSGSSGSSDGGWFDPTQYGDYSDYTGNDSGSFGSDVTGPTYDEMGYSGAGSSQQQNMDNNGWFGPSPNGGNLDQMVGSDQNGNPINAQGQMLNGGGSSIMGKLMGAAGGMMGGGQGGGQGGGGLSGGSGGGSSSGSGMSDLLLALGLGGAAAAFLPKLLNSASGGSSGQPSITAPNYYAQFQNAGGVGNLPNFNPGAPQGVAPGMQMATDPLAGANFNPAAMSGPQASGPVSPSFSSGGSGLGSVLGMDQNLSSLPTYFPGQ